MAKPQIDTKDTELDMTPMIDMVFLLIIFFILAGRISSEQRTEAITVPPTKTATKIEPKDRIIINIFGTTKTGTPPRNTIRIANQNFISKGVDDFTSYQQLRTVLDKAYDKADKEADPKNTGLMLPKVVIELRADADTEYRVVQEVLQVVTDTINPFDQMKPKVAAAKDMKPFVQINYTTRRPGENK